LIMPLLQRQLQQLPPAGLLALLRLCNWAGLQIGEGWLEGWAAAVQQQLPGLQSETACLMVAEVLRLKQQLPAGLMDTLFIGGWHAMLADCRSSDGCTAVFALPWLQRWPARAACT
jgi:hypothetical protein